MLGQLGFVLLIGSTLVTWPGFGYDEVRRPIAMLGVALILFEAVAIQRRGRPQLQPPLRLAALIDLAVAMHIVSVLVAINLHEAIKDLFPIVAGYVAFKGMARGWIDRKWVMFILAIVAILYCGYGIVEPVSTLGNTNYSGILAAVFAVACAGAALSNKCTIPSALAAIVAAIHVGRSDSRAALLGLMVGVTAVVLLVAWSRQAKFLPMIAILFLVPLPFVVPRDAVRSVPLVGTTDRTAQIRLGLWKGTLKLVAAHPVFGCGVGNFRIAFPPYRDAEELKLSMGDKGGAFPFAEDPHSTPLKVLSEAGPIALLALAGALLMALRVAVATIREAPSKGLMIAGVGGLVTLAVSGFFNSLSSHLPFTILAGCFAGFCIPAVAAKDEKPAPALQIAALLAGIAWVVGSLMYFAVDVNFRAGMLTSEPKVRQERMTAAIEVLDGAWRARFERANARMVLGDVQGAVADLQRVLAENPDYVPAIRLMEKLRSDK